MTTISIRGMLNTMPEKIQGIKEVRAITNMGLKEAKELIEDLPNSFDVGFGVNATDAVRRLRGYGYDAEVEGQSLSPPSSVDSDRAFKSFLVALIMEGEYDQVITFIKTKKHGSVAGAPNRTLETL